MGSIESIHCFTHPPSEIPRRPPRPFPEGGLLRLLISVGEVLHYLTLFQGVEKQWCTQATWTTEVPSQSI